MIEVTLEALTSGIGGVPVEELMSLAARTCYEGSKPARGKVIKLKDRIVDTGHHTVIQHINASFHIEGISVGDITLGLHMANVFYDTSQRSGRFCAEMFSAPDTDSLMSYLLEWNGPLSLNRSNMVRKYLDKAFGIYKKNLPRAIELTAEQMKKERHHCTEDYINLNAPKIAQEQMRVFVPVIFPTAAFYTVNLSALSALYRTAWNNVLGWTTEKMKRAVLDVHPELSYLFPEDRGHLKRFGIAIKRGGLIKKSPNLVLRGVPNLKGVAIPKPEDMHPWDLLPFSPIFMGNNTKNIDTTIEVSLATMGQDQRHRTIRRGIPTLTGNFYLPPIPAKLGLEGDANDLLRKWLELDLVIGSEGTIKLSPYGAMSRYEKSASLNAFFHEQAKRLCWCAQEEIYHVSRLLRVSMEKQLQDSRKKQAIFKAVTPPCITTGKCGEGTRCCRRSTKEAKQKPFPKRTV